jgi:hypothetical protein
MTTSISAAPTPINTFFQVFITNRGYSLAVLLEAMARFADGSKLPALL